MKKTLLGAILTGLAIAGTASAQTVIVDPSGGYAYGSPYNQLYDTTKMVTFSGKITGIQVMSPMPGMADGAVILVKAPNGGTALVDLGPAWYINNQPIRFNVKDKVEITGSKIIIDGRGTILAQRISRGANVLVLRNAGGAPLWAAFQTFPNGVTVDPIPNTNSITGTIEEVTTVDANGVPMSQILLRTGNGLTNIDLGPRWFVERQGMMFQPGNFVTVYSGGTPLQYGGNTVLPAFGVVSGNGFLRLRGINGWPFWQGWNPPRFLLGGG